MDRKDTIQVIGIVVIFIICISLFLWIFNEDRQDILDVYEKQIIVAHDNDMANVLDNVYIDHKGDEEGEENDPKHTVILTNANLDFVNLSVRYDETQNIMTIDYSDSPVFSSLVAIFLGIVIAIFCAYIWCSITDDLL